MDKPNLRIGIKGMSLVEVSISMAVTSVIAAVMLITLVTTQRSMDACSYHVQSSASQLRLLDYVAIDIRRATAVGAVTAGRVLTLSIPDFYLPGSTTPRTPTIQRGKVTYSNSDLQVYYANQDGRLTRTVVSGTASTSTVVATGVQNFSTTAAKDQQYVDVSVTFKPRFSFRIPVLARPSEMVSARILLRNPQAQ